MDTTTRMLIQILKNQTAIMLELATPGQVATPGSGYKLSVLASQSIDIYKSFEEDEEEG